MKHSDAGDDTSPPKPPPEVRQRQPPSFPWILALTNSYGFGVLPVYFRAGVTEKFEREYCPHLDTWRFMRSADQDEPPCSFQLSEHTLRGCPSHDERRCGLYVMNRCVGKSPDQARKAKVPPFEVDPKPDGNPLRDLPEWVTQE